MDTSKNPKNHERDDFSGFHTSQSYYANMKQNSSTELCGRSFIKTCYVIISMAPRLPKPHILIDPLRAATVMSVRRASWGLTITH